MLATFIGFDSVHGCREGRRGGRRTRCTATNYATRLSGFARMPNAFMLSTPKRSRTLSLTHCSTELRH